MIATATTQPVHHLILDRDAKTTPFAIHQPAFLTKSTSQLSEITWDPSTTMQSTEESLNLPDFFRWEQAVKWDGEIRRRFNDLSLRDALGEATREEKSELQLLLQKRRQLLKARSPSEIERDIRNRRALRKIVEGLSEYVEYL